MSPTEAKDLVFYTPPDWESRPQTIVSAVFMTYRQEAYVAEGLRSVLAQDYPKLEIIVSDDASPDRTFEIIQETLKGYQGPHRILLNRNEKNLRIGGQWNVLSRVASGEWLALFAGDDIADPDRVSAMMEVMKPYSDLLAVTARYRSMSPSGAIMFHKPLRQDIIYNPLGHDVNLSHFFAWIFNGASVFWSRRLFDFLRTQPKGIDSSVELDDDFLSWVAFFLSYQEGHGGVLETNVCKLTHREGIGISTRAYMRPHMSFRECQAIYDSWERYWLRQSNLWARLTEVFAPLFSDPNPNAIRAMKVCYAKLCTRQGRLRDLIREWRALPPAGRKVCLRAYCLNHLLGRFGFTLFRWIYSNTLCH